MCCVSDLGCNIFLHCFASSDSKLSALYLVTLQMSDLGILGVTQQDSGSWILVGTFYCQQKQYEFLKFGHQHPLVTKSLITCYTLYSREFLKNKYMLCLRNSVIFRRILSSHQYITMVILFPFEHRNWHVCLTNRPTED